MITPPEQCLDALQEATRRLGESPTKKQYEELGLRPASATIIRTIGGWNEAKGRANLETSPSTGSRVQPKPDGVELPDGTSWDDLSVDQRWHYRHPEENTERSLARRRRLRTWLYVHKASVGCSRCQESDPACLDFHHVGDDKEMAVNEMVVYGYSATDIHAEVETCEVLCANCDRREHYGPDVPEEGAASPLDASPTDTPTKRERLRAWAPEYQREQGCRRCDEADPSCLEFHHAGSGEKTKGVGAIISDSVPERAVHAEVEKCDVLCANCHRKEHYTTPPSIK
jgi:hypothetical protein